MKILRLTIVSGATLCLFLASNAKAESVVAVIDVKKVFDEHKGFQDKLAKIKGVVQTFETDFKGRIESLKKKRLLLDSENSPYKKDSRKYNEEIGRLARKASDLEVQRKLKQREVLERESTAYHETYRQIVNTVTAFADANGISLVLRYDSATIDRHNRPDVIKGVNRYVVFQRDRDLTRIIIKQLNPSTTP